MELEAQKHDHSSVATLTYSEENLPQGGSLVPKHATLWLKKLRKVLEPSKIRYFLVGEYGAKSKRPHYHVVLFGLRHDIAGGIDGRSGVVKKTWEHGNVLVDRLKPEAIAYVAGYVTKKLGKEELNERGLVREFTRMSLRPHGIGAGAIKDVAKAIRSVGIGRALQDGDVPTSFKIGSKVLPVGRYLRGKLRKELAIGVPDKNVNKPPEQKSKAYWNEMWQLRKSLTSSKAFQKGKTFKELIVDMNNQKILNLEARTELFKSRDTF